MKYLKSFRIFESSSEDLISIIKDIFISLDDSGVEYKIDSFEDIGLIHIKINDKSEEIDNCVEHLGNYLKDLGHLYFIGRKVENETHVSIEKNFNKKIEKDFLKILTGGYFWSKDSISGIKEIKHKNFPNSRMWISSDGFYLFDQNKIDGFFYYNYYRIYLFFSSKYSLPGQEISEIVRYLIGKYLKLETLTPYAADHLYNLGHLNMDDIL